VLKGNEWQLNHAEKYDSSEFGLESWVGLIAVLLDVELDVVEFVAVAEDGAVNVGGLDGELPLEQKLEEVVSPAALEFYLAQSLLVLLDQVHFFVALGSQVEDEQFVLGDHFDDIGEGLVQLYLVA